LESVLISEKVRLDRLFVVPAAYSAVVPIIQKENPHEETDFYCFVGRFGAIDSFGWSRADMLPMQWSGRGCADLLPLR